MSGWQTMDTAPKDGTWVLLKGGFTTEDFYNGPQPVAKMRAVTAFWDDEYPDEPQWSCGFWDGEWATAYGSPTHWMPIPE